MFISYLLWAFLSVHNVKTSKIRVQSETEWIINLLWGINLSQAAETNCHVYPAALPQATHQSRKSKWKFPFRTLTPHPNRLNGNNKLFWKSFFVFLDEGVDHFWSFLYGNFHSFLIFSTLMASLSGRLYSDNDMKNIGFTLSRMEYLTKLVT